MYKEYYYYFKTDPSKEPIDKVIAVDYEDALDYFAERKKMKEEIFMNLYVIEVYEKTKSK